MGKEFKTTNEQVKFRLFQMPCCGMLLCWVNPRFPNRCPECGEAVFVKLKSEEHTLTCCEATLRLGKPI